MIKMTNGDKTVFVFDCHVEQYTSQGYKPVKAGAPKVAPEPVIVEDELPVEEDAAPEDVKSVGYEPNAEGKYVCPYCGKDYSTKANLKKHIESKHPDEQ